MTERTRTVRFETATPEAADKKVPPISPALVKWMKEAYPEVVSIGDHDQMVAAVARRKLVLDLEDCMNEQARTGLTSVIGPIR